MHSFSFFVIIRLFRCTTTTYVWQRFFGGRFWVLTRGVPSESIMYVRPRMVLYEQRTIENDNNDNIHPHHHHPHFHHCHCRRRPSLSIVLCPLTNIERGVNARLSIAIGIGIRDSAVWTYHDDDASHTTATPFAATRGAFCPRSSTSNSFRISIMGGNDTTTCHNYLPPALIVSEHSSNQNYFFICW